MLRSLTATPAPDLRNTPYSPNRSQGGAAAGGSHSLPAP
jgi:hypothetical protein